MASSTVYTWSYCINLASYGLDPWHFVKISRLEYVTVPRDGLKDSKWMFHEIKRSWYRKVDGLANFNLICGPKTILIVLKLPAISWFKYSSAILSMNNANHKNVLMEHGKGTFLPWRWVLLKMTSHDHSMATYDHFKSIGRQHSA